ncbi:MAG: PBSX family phage terminase large subunit [Candidatus Binatia bacterium]
MKTLDTTAEISGLFRPLFSPYRFKAYYGGRGGMKSHSFATALLIKATERRLRILCAREIQVSIRDSVKRLLDDKIANLHFYDTRRRRFFPLSSFYNSTQNEIRGANGSMFVFAGLRTDPEKIQSMEGIDIAWVEESHTVSQHSLDILLPTVRKPGSEIWFTWNPRYESDPVDAMFRGKAGPPPRSLVREVSWQDNPWLPGEQREQMEWQRARDPDKYAWIWEGHYVRRSEARVFRNWRVGSEAEFNAEGKRLYYGADWGFSDDPSVMVRCWIEGRTLYVDYEAWAVHCEIDKTPALFDRIPDSRKWPCIADSARPETISYMRRNGFPNMRPARKGPNSVEEGVEFLKNFDIVVHPRCRHVIDELTLYSYKVDKQTAEILPMLEDRKNHCIAEGTLVTCLRGDIPIEHVTTDDRVLTRGGYQRVLFAGLTDVDRETVVVITTNGLLCCTPDHEILTPHGPVRADALIYDDEIFNLYKRPSNEMDADIAPIPPRYLQVSQLTNAFDSETWETLGEEEKRMLTKGYSSLINAQDKKPVVGRMVWILKAPRCPRVYDLTVEKHHEFFAGNVLVSNCIDAFRYALEGQRRVSTWLPARETEQQIKKKIPQKAEPVEEEPFYPA